VNSAELHAEVNALYIDSIRAKLALLEDIWTLLFKKLLFIIDYFYISIIQLLIYNNLTKWAITVFNLTRYL